MKKAFVKYVNGYLVSGVLLLLDQEPVGSGWMEVPATYCCSNVPRPPVTAGRRGWIKYSAAGDIVPGSTIIRKTRPKDGLWMEVPYERCC